VAKEPGNLTDLPAAGREAWDRSISEYLAGSTSQQLLAYPDDRTPTVVSIDWGAYPVRVTECLQRRLYSDRLLDWSTGQGDVGRAQLQEEYFEWRMVRDVRGAIVRVEMTTEFPEYWEILAAHDPARTLMLVAEFAGEATVVPQLVYGGLDPLAPGVTPDQRKAAFIEAMLPRGGSTPWSEYNNGKRAICFMSQGANTLGALIGLVAAAAFPLGAADAVTGGIRKLTGPEAIATGTQAAQSCRNSDPTVVGATIGLAWEGHLFALDDPIGIYIQSVDHARLRMPDGSPVGMEWFTFQRGSRPDGSDPQERSQRLVMQAPAGTELSISDLVDSQTDERVQYGGQVADLVKLAAHVRVSGPGVVMVERQELNLPSVVPCRDDSGCDAIRELWRRFQIPPPNDLSDTTADITNRVGGPI
jgi:hypothetical protein